MKITNPVRFTVACSVAASLLIGGGVLVGNTISNHLESKNETTIVASDYIPYKLQLELMESYNLSQEDLDRGINTYIKKHPDWKETINNEDRIISWFAPSTNAMYEFYNEYR